MKNENPLSIDDVRDASRPLVVEDLTVAQPAPPAAKLREHRPQQNDSPDAQPSRKEKPSRSGPGTSPTALQDLFLNGLRRENIDVVIYFTDGSQERGVVRAFDTFTLLVENRNSGKAQLIYKHAVTRIFPVRTPSDLKMR